MRTSSLELSSIALSLFGDREPTGLGRHFPTGQHGQKLIKGQLTSPDSSVFPPHIEPTEQLPLPNFLHNALLQYPRLFHRCHRLGQWRHSLRDPARGHHPPAASTATVAATFDDDGAGGLQRDRRDVLPKLRPCHPIRFEQRGSCQCPEPRQRRQREYWGELRY
ncbi:hypothetical protein EI94DRAFT_1305178 [Lactarius quietus]|nr:hypothetical protein EI94DRAFT_1305178 [Lactarius quietus]